MRCYKEDCCGQLKEDNSDYRQEWSEVYYVCQECDSWFTLRTDYKLQSKVIDKQVMLDEDNNEVE